MWQSNIKASNPSTCRVAVTHQVSVPPNQTENEIRNLQELKHTREGYSLSAAGGAVAMAGACTCTCTCLLVAATGEMTHRGSSSVFRTPDLGHLADRERGPVTTVVTYPDPATNLRGTSPSVASPAARVRLASADCGCRRKSGRVGNWDTNGISTSQG